MNKKAEFIKGKCYSKCNRGQRNKSDFYQTYPWMVEELLCLYDPNVYNPRYAFSVLEPACGNGSITKVLEANFNNVVSYDIQQGKDFLQETEKFEYIITNPPYSVANEFVLKASEICIYAFCYLLPLNFLQGQWRYDNFYKKQLNGFLLSYVYIFNRMIMLSKKLNYPVKTGMQTYAWFIWEQAPDSCGALALPPAIGWIDCRPYLK